MQQDLETDLQVGVNFMLLESSEPLLTERLKVVHGTKYGAAPAARE